MKEQTLTKLLFIQPSNPFEWKVYLHELRWITFPPKQILNTSSSIQYSDGAEALTHCVEIIFEGLLSVNFLCLFFTKCFLNFVSKTCFQNSAKLRSITCAVTSFFFELSHVIYLKLTRVIQECLLSLNELNDFFLQFYKKKLFGTWKFGKIDVLINFNFFPQFSQFFL